MPATPSDPAGPADPAGSRETILAARVVLFDLDGTLIDSAKALARCWTTWAQEYAVTPERFFAAAALGRTSESVVRDLVPPERVPEALRRIEQLESTDVADIVALPGAHTLLAALPPERWAVVTSGSRPVAEARLAAAGIAPRVLVTADDVRRGKPDPEPFLRGAQRAGSEPADCLVIEDAALGLAAGRAAGMRTIGVDPKRSGTLDADLVVEGLHQLTANLDAGRLTIRAGRTA